MAEAKPRSFKLPADLDAAASLRAKALGYRTLTDYIRGLIRYDLLVQGAHTVTLPISHMPLSEQDRVDAKLLRLTQDGEGERGQLLQRIIERVQNPDAVGKALAE